MPDLTKLEKAGVWGEAWGSMNESPEWEINPVIIWEIARRKLDTESGAAVGVFAELHSAMSCAPCVTVVHSDALPLLGKIHVVTLGRRAVTQLNRLVCNLTPGRAFAMALPTESLFKKERDESSAPDSATPLHKRTPLSLRLRVLRFGSA